MHYISKKNTYLEGHKIEIFPTDKQIEIIERSFELARYVWNWALEQEENQYNLFKEGKVDKSFLNIYDLKHKFTEARKNNPFLYQIQYESAVYVMKNIIVAYENFFKDINNKPKFKSKKRSKNIIPLRNNTTYFENNMLRIPGLPIGDKIYTKYYTNKTKHDNIKYYKCSITKDNLGKYWFNFVFEKEKKLNYFKENNIPKTKPIGIDLNVENTIVCSNGDIYKKPNFRKINRRIKKYSKCVLKDYNRINEQQKELERTNSVFKVLPSKNAKKRANNLRKAYKKKKDKMHNFINQSISKIIKMNPAAIVMEDLDVIDMQSIHSIAQLTYDCDFGLIYYKMKYKCDIYGIPFITADRYFASSRICSNCGHKKQKSSYKIYHCDNCGLVIDRDLNAALNLASLAEDYDYDFENLIVS